MQRPYHEVKKLLAAHRRNAAYDAPSAYQQEDNNEQYRSKRQYRHYGYKYRRALRCSDAAFIITVISSRSLVVTVEFPAVAAHKEAHDIFVVSRIFRVH